MIQTTQGAAATNGAAALPELRFTAGALSRVEGPHFDQTIVPGATAQPYNLMEIPTGGWERTIFLLVSCTIASGNSAAVAFQPDAPWAALQEITFRDARGNTVIGPLTGFDLYLANKWLGYSFGTDLTNSPNFSATSGSGGTGGSFSFVLPIPLELIGRDAIGALANGASNTALRVNLTLAPSASIYSTAPTVLTGVRVRAFHEAWQQPEAGAGGFAYRQSPIGAGTFHQITKTNYAYVASENRIALARKGNPIRGMAFVFRTAAAARTATPALLGLNPFQLFYEGSDLLSMSEDLIRYRMWSTNINATSGFDTGLLVLDWASDFDGKVGSELREQWLKTQPGSRLEVRFTAGVAGNLDVITDEVVPAGDLVYVP